MVSLKKWYERLISFSRLNQLPTDYQYKVQNTKYKIKPPFGALLSQ